MMMRTTRNRSKEWESSLKRQKNDIIHLKQGLLKKGFNLAKEYYNPLKLVAYFKQKMGALHTIGWSKSSF